MINFRKPTGRVINLAELGDSLFDDHPEYQNPEPEFTKKIEADLYKQENEGTLSNPSLWKDIETKWETALVAADNSGEQLEYTDETVVHEYWYLEILTSAQREAYPYMHVSTGEETVASGYETHG